MSISTITSCIWRIQDNINTILKQIADKRKKLSEAQSKSSKAYADALKTKSESTLKSKIFEYNRQNDNIARLTKEIAELEKKYANKNKELTKEQEKLQKEQTAEAKKTSQERLKIDNATDKKLKTLTQTVKTVQLEQAKLKQLYPLLTVSSEDAYDVFISHASEDKSTFVDGLVKELVEREVKVWYDRKVLTWGRSIRQNIDAGLRQSKFAIVVLSEDYIRKYWTQKEFNALFNLGSQLGDFILPIWHNITPERAQEFSPMLSDSIALKSSDYTQAEIADLFVEKLNYDNNG